MRVVVHDYGGYPFSAQLAGELARRGHSVTYLHATGFRSPKAAMAQAGSEPQRLEVRGVDIGEAFRRGASVRRLRQERHYGTLASAVIRELQPEVVISANCPLDAQAILQDTTHFVGGAFVFWLQDLYSIAVGRLLGRRLPILGTAIGARYGRLERSLLRSSDAIVAISPDFVGILARWRVAPDRVAVVENWAPLGSGTPARRTNAWAAEHGLVGATVLLYAGTLGRKHNPGLLLKVADAVPSATVVVVADGVGADWLRRQDAPPNLVLLPLQPAERLPEVLATADVLLAVLEHDAGAFSVPSKVLSYLAAGRPTLAAIPSTNAAARLIRQSEAGIVVDPGDTSGFIAAAVGLLGDEPRCAAMGAAARAAAEERFQMGPIADRFESILSEARERSARRLAGPSDTADASKHA